MTRTYLLLRILGKQKPLLRITEEIMLMVAQVHSNWNALLEELSRWLQLYRVGE